MDAVEYLHGHRHFMLNMDWSPECDAILYQNGRTLVVVERLSLILEGAFATRVGLPHFGYLLHLVRAFLHDSKDLRILHQAYLQSERAPCSRNIGLLIAELCRDVPAVAAPPTLANVIAVLKQRLLFPESPQQPGSTRPPLTMPEFTSVLTDALARWTEEDLVHWLTFGCAPAKDAGKKLADELPTTPSLAAELRLRPRLAGAAHLLPALNAALSLPPRKLETNALPMGGYSGVITRGTPERLLPSQFALDSLDFVRRFAEHELLYFRREDPQRAQSAERWLIVDQGVRTWGGVRLAVAAAVVSMLTRTGGPAMLAFSSQPGPPRPASDWTPKALADLLEASDFTRHPATTLGESLREPCVAPRDLLLLTHPRSLGESRPACRELRPGDRLFALTVADDGRAELSEYRGGFVRLRGFRVDLPGALAVEVDGKPAPSALGNWTGDVEPMGFPFRPGLLGEPQLFAFDVAGEHLLIAGPDGLLTLAKLDGSAAEVLPRAMIDGQVLRGVRAVLGFDGGFAVRGAAPKDRERVVVHYDLVRRRVTCHPLLPLPEAVQPQWYAFPDLHCVAMRSMEVIVAVDLETGGVTPSPRSQPGLIARACEAIQRCARLGPPPPNIAVLPGINPLTPSAEPWVKVGSECVWLGNVEPAWPPFKLVSDGQAIPLPEAKSIRGQFAGRTLALHLVPTNETLVLEGPSGRLARRLQSYRKGASPALSQDGRWLAVQTHARRVQAYRAVTSDGPVTQLNWAAIHTGFQAWFAGVNLRIAVGHHVHTFRVGEMPFSHHYTGTADAAAEAAREASRGASVAGPNLYDAMRFCLIAKSGSLAAWADRWGQLILCDSHNEPVVYLLVRREMAAAVTPDGAAWGSVALLGTAPTPGAIERIGMALRRTRGGA